MRLSEFPEKHPEFADQPIPDLHTLRIMYDKRSALYGLANLRVDAHKLSVTTMANQALRILTPRQHAKPFADTNRSCHFAVSAGCDRRYGRREYMSESVTMPHRMLGRTGLQVSVLSYGFWATFGAKEGLSDEAGIQQAMACLKTARAHGVNLFDNAEVYGSPRGEAERIMGEAIARLAKDDPNAWRRSDILVTTKIFWGGDGVNEKGTVAKAHH